MMLHMANLLIELYLLEQCMSSSGDKLFTDMIRRRDRELRSMEMKLQGARYLVLTCSNRDEEKANFVELRVVQLSGFVEQ